MKSQINKWIKEKEYRKCFDLISKSMTHRQCVEWAVFSAEGALPFYTGKSKAPKEAIEAAKRCLVENFSPESVKAAAAAYAAAAAAAAAAYAAYAAAAAYYAAYAADAAAYAAYAAYAAAAHAADAAAAWAAYAADAAAWAVNNKKEIALKIIEKGLDILEPVSVKFMKSL